MGEAAIGRPNVIPGVPLKNPNYDGKYETPYINNKAFGDVFGTFGSAPRQLSGLREPGQLREDLSVLKNIRITEKVRFQFRTEFFNAFNRHRFRPSSLNYSDTFVYGASDPFCGCTLSNLADSPREIQFSARIDW